jgi:hypothetical protein
MNNEIEAVHSGIIKLGAYEIDCYVLSNEKRVISQSALIKFISGGRVSGDLRRYLRAKSISTYLPARLQNENYDSHVVKFKAGGTIAHGLEASDVIDFCNAYLQARQVGALAPNQIPIAEVAEIFVQASAKTGIDAVIDEATGYEFFKKANDLQEKLATYLQEGYRQWTLTFEREFFLQLYKLEGIKPPMPLKKFPKRFGRYVMRYVYDTLDPEIADWLRQNNLKPRGQEHHHQKFNDFGYNRLRSHVMSVVGIMKASPTMERFKENLAIAFPNARTQRMARLEQNKQARQEETASASLAQGSIFEFL